MKKCRGCYNEKPKSHYNKSGRSKDGITNFCRACLETMKTRKKENIERYFRGGVQIPSENYLPELGDKKTIGWLSQKRIYVYVRRLDNITLWVPRKEIENVSPKQKKYMLGKTDVNPDDEYWANNRGWWDGGQRMPQNHKGGLTEKYVKSFSQLTS